jgi:hypothetical protein
MEIGGEGGSCDLSFLRYGPDFVVRLDGVEAGECSTVSKSIFLRFLSTIFLLCHFDEFVVLC